MYPAYSFMAPYSLLICAGSVRGSMKMLPLCFKEFGNEKS